MANELYIPDLNPVRFYEIAPTALPQYLSKHFDTYPFKDQQVKWEQPTDYKQKWQTSDIIPLQFESDFDPIQIDVIDQYDISKLTLGAVVKGAHKYLPGFYIYEISLSWATLPVGCYWLKLTAGSPALVTMISEPILLKVTHPNTLLLEYRNSRYHGDVIFETGIKFGFRVEGRIGKLNPGSSNTLYEDQKLNPTVLSSRPFRSFPLLIGGARGVPDWVVDKINIIWTCNDVTVDGKSFAKSGETKLDLKDQDRYPMRGIVMEVREGVNRGSKIIGATLDPNKRIIVVYNIDSQLFGDLSNQASSNIIQITSID